MMKTQIHQLKEEVKTLKDELLLVEEARQEADKHMNILGKLYDMNMIDQEGNPI